ncbi:glycosyltransferase family 25 protein [Mesorhizobium opportunistum]|uniref:Glycosyltransferase family 25 protein n=1 Tax=Mesorhizobium opportunistum TaxID=593909 RepID=A0ABV1YG87_9HYPH|nr:glycosyltransferase family 25 protein [Mesorhizobium sp.]TIN97039.1 MAG: glycosyltransferase family 25 protein [Mesorhizobium sp.]TJU99985.1 MAG: glycosyltransferase family 25 protein [Mesorhizobium sp.]TJV16908.1 MAG: glycosyltransferase family 25 protein [Mesorhizobium sp.]
MKRLVINLDRSPDRLAHMASEFARIGIGFERIAGIDAQDHPNLVLQPQHAIHAIRPLAGSEIACLHSHRACWTIIAQDDAPYGAVFEDDMVFSGRAGALLGDTSWVPAGADVVKLETFFSRTVIQRRRAPAGHGFSTVRLRKGHPGAGGYLLSRQMARAFLEATAQVNIAVDDLIFNPAMSAGRNIYQLVPALCAQDQFVGDRLPSLLDQERDAARTASGLMARQSKPTAVRISREAGRTVRWIADFCRLRRQIVVPFGPIEATD